MSTLAGEPQSMVTRSGGTEERRARVVRGAPVLLLVLLLAFGGVGLAVAGGLLPLIDGSERLSAGVGVPFVAGVLMVVAAVGLCFGFFVLEPNEAEVLILFGRYVGTVDQPGLWWSDPLTSAWREKISLRVRNFQSERTKVNDASGSPIELAAVVVWRVVDTARASFDVEDFNEFVVVQSETAVRHVATKYPYDDFEGGGLSLQGNADEVSETLHAELQARLAPAGLEVIETRLTHLAYAPEIAEAMLRRQQASAVVAARKIIVAGAVGLVDMALAQIAADDIVDLDEERKAAMVSNLMVVLAGDRAPTPVINAGTLYS